LRRPRQSPHARTITAGRRRRTAPAAPRMAATPIAARRP